MKITIENENEAKGRIKTHAKYDDVYIAADKLEKGKCIVIEFDTDREAKNATNAFTSARYGGKLLNNCYISKSGKFIIIGKN